MRIFYLVTKSEAGGAQTHIYQLSKYFIEKEDEVAIMSYPGEWLEEEVRKLGIEFYSNKYFSNIPNPFTIFKAMKEIKKVVKDFKPDLVGCHSTAAGFLGRLAIRNKIPTIFTAHGWAFTEGVPWWRRYSVLLAEKIAGKYCSKIICVSDFDKKLALKYKIASPDKLVVIHNGVEIEKVKSQKSKVKSLEKKIRIVFVGRLAQPKTPLLLLKAFNDLPPELKDKAQISIIGEGPKRKELEKFIKENRLEEKVKLLGEMLREKVFEVLKKSDIFVLTSNWEGFPITILEAMSFGLAIVASDVGGAREAIEPFDDAQGKSCGILVKRGDKEGLKIALEKLLKNPGTAQEMGEKARERVEKEFSLEKMLRATEQVYQEVLFSFKK